MEIKKVKGNTFCIDTGTTYIPFYKINNEEIIMLDSGWANREREEIDKAIENSGFKIAGIICSHAHRDHIGNNAYFKEKYNCVIAMTSYEALLCSSAVNFKAYYSNHTLSDVIENFGHMICKTDIMISDEQDSVCICNTKFKVVHTPGHSPAHICIATPDDVLYLGDSLISYEVMRGSKMPYSYILKEDLKSKTKLYDLKYSKYVVAHKGIYDDITVLITDNINFYKDKAKRIHDIIDSAMTMEDILKAVAKNFNIHVNSTNRYIFIERMLKSYVEYLKEIGCLELNMEDGFLKYSKS